MCLPLMLSCFVTLFIRKSSPKCIHEFKTLPALCVMGLLAILNMVEEDDVWLEGLLDACIGTALNSAALLGQSSPCCLKASAQLEEWFASWPALCL